MIVCKINVKQIDKTQLFVGAKHTYLDLALHENRDGEDQYGNLGFITQSVSKEARDRGEKGPIIGNWKDVGQKRPVAKSESEHVKAKADGYAPKQKDEDGDDLPF